MGSGHAAGSLDVCKEAGAPRGLFQLALQGHSALKVFRGLAQQGVGAHAVDDLSRNSKRACSGPDRRMARNGIIYKALGPGDART